MKIERECSGYKYTAVDDKKRTLWYVDTDYINNTISISQPDDTASIETFQAFGRAIVKACRDMKRESGANNRFPVK